MQAGVVPWCGANLLQALTPGPVTRGSCLPVTSWVEVLFIPLTQSRPQLFNISMKPVKGYRYVKWPCQRLVAKLLLCKTALNSPAPFVPSPSSDLWGWGHPIFFFLVFPGHPEFWTPLQIPVWAPTPCLHPVSIWAEDNLGRIFVNSSHLGNYFQRFLKHIV